MSRIMAVTASHRLMSQKDKGKFMVLSSMFVQRSLYKWFSGWVGHCNLGTHVGFAR